MATFGSTGSARSARFARSSRAGRLSTGRAELSTDREVCPQGLSTGLSTGPRRGLSTGPKVIHSVVHSLWISVEHRGTSLACAGSPGVSGRVRGCRPNTMTVAEERPAEPRICLCTSRRADALVPPPTTGASGGTAGGWGRSLLSVQLAGTPAGRSLSIRSHRSCRSAHRWHVGTPPRIAWCTSRVASLSQSAYHEQVVKSRSVTSAYFQQAIA